MAANIAISPDKVDTASLEALQDDGRLTITELGRCVRMSNSEPTERVRRLEEIGVISGYRATVDPERIGFSVPTFLRLCYPSSIYGPLHDLLRDTPEVIEAHDVTGTTASS
jgi:Lrp/AsnC family transcriptional regulator, leucine-responsive regulatory protein